MWLRHLTWRNTLSILALVSWSQFAPGNDWYADAVHGNDANDGSTPAKAWLTLTHVIGVPQTGPNTLHVAPGVYGPQSGEQFPLLCPPQLRIVGDLGSAHSILDGEGSASGILVYWATVWNGWNYDEQSGAEGLTLRRAGGGVWRHTR